MRTLYLHIGTPKTGTSALQRFFYANRDRLQKRGILYPEWGLVGDCHHRIGAAFYAYEHRPEYIRYPGTLPLEEYGRLILGAEGDVLISSELLSHGFLATRLRAVLGEISIKIIVYLRRQDEFAVSRYNEEVKALYRGTFDEYAISIAKQLDYRVSILDGWAGEWGKDNVTVRTYEKSALGEKGIFSDFCEQGLGLSLDADFEIPSQRVNPRLPRTAMLYKLAVNRLPLSDRTKCDLAGPLVWWSSQRVCQSAEPEQADGACEGAGLGMRSLTARYADSNAWIAREYLQRPSGRLFFDGETAANPPLLKVSDLVVETAKDISAFILATAPDVFARLSQGVREGLSSADVRTRESAVILARSLEFLH